MAPEIRWRYTVAMPEEPNPSAVRISAMSTILGRILDDAAALRPAQPGRPMIAALVAAITVLATPAVGWAQDQQVGQDGAVWNLGELAPRAYPSTLTAVNESCPGDHDFHISLEGEAADFIIITGPTILTDIPPGASKTSDVVVNLRRMTPGPHNEGVVVVRCVDCPPICTQDYEELAVHLTVLGDASAAPGDAFAVGTDSPWNAIDLTLLDPTLPVRATQTSGPPAAGESPYRWLNPNAFGSTTLVQDAVANGMAELAFTGTGRAAGYIFRLTITRTASTPFEMSFRLGTLIVPDDSKYSPMMLGDDGAVALLDEVTVVNVPGYSLNPNLALSPTTEQIDGNSSAPTWSVVGPPDSGQFSEAVGIIKGGYALAGTFDSDMESNDHLAAVTQRAIWFVLDAANFGKPRLEQDIAAQVEATDGSQTEEEVQDLADNLWDDVLRAINEGKNSG